MVNPINNPKPMKANTNTPSTMPDHMNSTNNAHGGEEILAGTLHSRSYGPYTYRTKDGSAYYMYRYVQVPQGYFEIDILSQPDYGARDTRMNVIHRLPSDRGGHKICISQGFEPTDLEKAKRISTEWAELTNVFIKTGKSIDQQVSENARRSRPAPPPPPTRQEQDRSLFRRLLDMLENHAN